MIIRTLQLAVLASVLASALAIGAAAPALAQACTRQGNDVSCDDGRRGIFRATPSCGRTARRRGWLRRIRA